MLRKMKLYFALFLAISMIFVAGAIPTAVSFKAANDVHEHIAECYELSYEFGELICEKEEHTHSDSCFEDEIITEVVYDEDGSWHYEETITKSTYFSMCGLDNHIHDESCYEQIEVKTLICEKEETESLAEYNFHVKFLYPDEETGNYVAVENGAYDFTTKIKSDGSFIDGAFDSPSIDGYFWYDMHILRDKVSDSGQLKFEGINKKTYDLGDNMTWTANHQARVYAYQPTDGEINGNIVLELLYAPLPEMELATPEGSNEEEEIVPPEEDEVTPPEGEKNDEEVLLPEEEEEEPKSPIYTLTVRYWFDNKQLSEPTVVNLQSNGFIEGFALENGHMDNAITTKIFKDYVLYNTVVSKYEDQMPSRKNIDLNETGLSDNFIYITGVSGDGDFEVSDNYVIDVYYTKNQEDDINPITPFIDNNSNNNNNIIPPNNFDLPIDNNVSVIDIPNIPDMITPEITPIEELENLNIVEDIIINAEEVENSLTEIPIAEISEQIITITDGEEEPSITLTSIDEVETALADIALKNHVCNILAFIMLLSTTIALILYFRSARVHQERIFELRKLLGEDDPYIREFA